MSDVRQFIEQRKEAMRRETVRRFERYAGVLSSRISESLLRYVSPNQRAEGTWSSSPILQSKTFALREALAGIGRGSTARVEVSAKGVEVRAGVNPDVVKHASIQNVGGIIRSKGSMHKFFWARFIATKLPWYRIMALHLKRVGSVTIKAKPFMAPGTRDAVERAQSEMPGQIALLILESFEA